MKIALGEIVGKAKRLTVEGNDWLPGEDGVTAVVPAVVEIVLRREDENSVDLTGSLRGVFQLACDRCGEATDCKIDEEFFYQLTTEPEEIVDQPEVECSDDASNTLHLEEPIVDIAEILREQLFLALPLKMVCREDCQGLCQQCGSNLNRGGCDCARTSKNSPFAVLKALKKK